MKSGNSETSPFKTGQLPRKIADLPGVEQGQLNRHFPKGRSAPCSADRADKSEPLRSKVVEGLGLTKGRRFFKTER